MLMNDPGENPIDEIPDVDFDDIDNGDTESNESGFGDIGDDDDFEFPVIDTLDAKDHDGEDDGETEDEVGYDIDKDGSDNQPTDDVTAQLSDMLDNYGIKYDVSQHKDEKLSPEQAKEIFKQQVGMEYLQKVNPSLAAAMKHGIDPNQYNQQMQQLDSMVKLSDEALLKDNLFRSFYKAEQYAGTLPENEKEAQDYLVELVESRYSKMSEDRIANLASSIRGKYSESMKNLPLKLQEAQEAQSKEAISRYNENVESFITNEKTKEYFEEGGIIPYAKKSDKEGFMSYVKEQLSVKDKGAAPFMAKLQNDGKFLLDVMRLTYEQQNGSLANVEKRATKKAFNKLDSFSSTSRDAAASKSSRSKKHIDTSKPR